MQNTYVKTKDGKEYYGPILKWRPYENWFSIIWNDESKKFSFDEIESAVTKGTRININTVGDVDELERARENLKDGRKYNWKEYPKEKFDWE